MKKFIQVLIVCVLFISTIGLTTVQAEDYEDYAVKLSKLGVFKGTGSGFELDRAPTRIEAAVMFVRLLGAEQEALNKNYKHPFGDVTWGHEYVGYLYTKGLTKGTSATTFGSTDIINAKSYMTFILRALGYSDSAGDFSWNEALEFALNNKLIDESVYNEMNTGAFYRGHLAKISYLALMMPVKDEKEILAKKLVDIGAIDMATAIEIGLGPKGEKNDDSYDKMTPNDSDPNILWSYIIEGSYVYYASPALSADEKTVYFGTSFAVKQPQSDNDRIVALNRDGTLKWEYHTGKGEIRSNITVYKENLYFAADYGRKDGARERAELIALDQNGKELWRKKIADSSRTHDFGLSNAAAANDRVLVVTDYLYVFDYLTGKELDKEPINPGSSYMGYIRPVVNSDSAYFLTDGILYEYNFTTSALTKKEMSSISPDLPKGSATNAIRFDSDGNLYIGYGSLVVSLDKDKNHRWTYDSGNSKISFRSTPVINEENRLLFIGTKNNEDSQLLAINIDTGKLEWSYDTGGDVYSSPAIYNGLIYACAEKGYMHILKQDGTLVQKILVKEEITWPSPVIDKQGVLYIAGMGNGSSRGFVYAIKTLQSD